MCLLETPIRPFYFLRTNEVKTRWYVGVEGPDSAGLLKSHGVVDPTFPAAAGACGCRRRAYFRSKTPT